MVCKVRDKAARENGEGGGGGKAEKFSLRIKNVKHSKNPSATQANLCEDLATKGLNEKTSQLKEHVLGKKKSFQECKGIMTAMTAIDLIHDTRIFECA